MKTVVLSAFVACVSGYGFDFMPEAEIVDLVNRDPAATWRAAKSLRFANHTLSDIQGMLKTIIGTHDLVTDTLNLPDFAISNADLPESFDSRQQWPDCIHPIRDQAQCGSCWAFGASEALSDRFCIFGGDNVVLSPQYLVSCDRGDFGCNGGLLGSAWKAMKAGIPSDKCMPYSSSNGDRGACMRKCVDGSDPKLYKAKSAYSVVGLFDFGKRRVNKIKHELITNGPVEVAFTVYQDFMNYDGGVYRHLQGAQLGGHAVKLVGWGDGFWIVANSWSDSWGEKGFFRIAMGTNECGIESQVWAGMPDV